MSEQAKAFPRVLLAAGKDTWETPRALFDKLKGPFAIELDPCTTHDNPLGTTYFLTEGQDALKAPWLFNAFINPPYPKTKEFLQCAVAQQHLHKTVNVFLMAARTDTKAMQLIGFPNARAICFIKGRLKFGGSKNSATFPSALLIFDSDPLTEDQLMCLQELGYTIEQ